MIFLFSVESIRFFLHCRKYQCIFFGIESVDGFWFSVERFDNLFFSVESIDDVFSQCRKYRYFPIFSVECVDGFWFWNVPVVRRMAYVWLIWMQYASLWVVYGSNPNESTKSCDLFLRGSPSFFSSSLSSISYL